MTLPRTVQDPILGELKLNRLSSQKFWQGNVNFGPSGSTVEIYLFDLDSGQVSELQRKFYRDLEVNYLTLVRSIEPLLEIPDAVGINSESKEFGDALLVESISFPPNDALMTGSFEWDLIFMYCPAKSSILVEMSTWTPETAYWDK